MQCNDGFGKYRSWEEICKKSGFIWSFESKVMACWTSLYTLSSFEHIFSTIHHKFMILDFLEMGEKDIQLSCWTNFHLKLLWCWKVELKWVQKLVIFGNFQITGHFPFLETFDLASNSSMWVFEMSNETCLNMNEVFLITSHLQIHSWLSRPSVDWEMFWWNSSLYHLEFCFKITS